MNCQNIDHLLSEGAPLDASAREHIAGCPACNTIVAALGEVTPKPGSEKLNQLKTRLSSNLRPVRAFPSDRKLVALLLLFFVAFSVTAAWPAHYFGLRALNATQMVIYFGVIMTCAFLSAITLVQEIIPGSQRRISPMLAVVLGVVGLVAVALILFPNFDSSHFVSYGKGCLRVGSICGVIAGLLLGLALRRGFFSSPVKASITIGFFASLAGVAVLALHCGLLTIPHILVWHFGVLLLGLAAGAGLGMLLEIGILQRFSGNRNFPNTVPE